MGVHSTNKTNLGSIDTAIGTLRTNASLATGDERKAILCLAKTLEREVAYAKKTIQGI